MDSTRTSTSNPVAAFPIQPQQLERKYTIAPLALGLLGMLIPLLGLTLVPICFRLAREGRKRIAQGQTAPNRANKLAMVLCWLIIPLNLIVASILFIEFNYARNSKLHDETFRRAYLLERSINEFESKWRRYPKTLEELKSVEPSIELNDAWDVPFVYELKVDKTVTRNAKYTITSLGVDGALGGDGPNADIVRGTGAPARDPGIWFD